MGVNQMEIENFTFGNVLQKSWQIYKLIFNKLIAVSITFKGPYYLIYILLYYNTTLTRLNKNILDLVFDIIYIVGIIAMIYLADKALSENSEQVSYSDALKIGGSLFGAAFLTLVIKYIIIIIGTLLVIIPGIAFSGFFQFSEYIVVLRNKKNIDALKYSTEVVIGYWWELFGYAILLSLILAIPYLVLWYLNKELIGSVEITFAIEFLGMAFVTPFIHVFYTILFNKFNSIYIKEQ